MYFKNYNPTLHDVYLYGPGNSGYPTALNPECLIYGASGSYRAISLRERQWGITGSCGGPPPGATPGAFPNYYNIGYPLFWWVSETMLGACTHFTEDRPCDTITSFILGANTSFFVKETGLTASYGRYYWDSNYSTKTFYDNFRGIYNCVEYQPYTDVERYFQGWSGACSACEAQAPGFSAGNTWYQITTTDYSFSRLPSYATYNKFEGKPLRSISPFMVLSQEQITGITSYLVSANDNNPFELGNIVYEFPVNDVYFWGGNDTIQPVSKLRLGFRQLYTLSTSDWKTQQTIYKRGPYVRIIFSDESETLLWAGDSSGLLLYKKGNELYSILSLLSTSGLGELHASTVLPPREYLRTQTDIRTDHFFSNRISGTPATTSGMSALQVAMATALVNAQNKYQSLVTKPLAPSGLTYTEVSSSGVTLQWTDNANNEVGFKIFYFDTTVYPEVPTGFTASIPVSTGTTLSWTDNSSIEDGFKIFYYG